MQGRVTYGVNYNVSPPAIVRDGVPDALGPAVRLSRDVDSPAPDRLHSIRAFHLHTESGTPLARVATGQPLGSRLSGRPAVYRVLDPSGAPIGRITLRRRRAFRPGRKRWTVEPVSGPTLRGYQGRLVWWAVWWPAGLPVSLAMLVMSLLGDGNGAIGPPRSVIWRDGSGRAHLDFRATAEDYRLLTPDLDPRLVNALIALHQSLDPPEGTGLWGWYGE
ncbi:hypothetical protein AB0D65_12210 [Streptomyces griseoloalbus]|uniref:Uncharacterized protein n=1 Tax=Streptomyces griseoloalbus TaxID=67303 RepID=A0ABV3E3P6_9ACTN